MPSIEDLGEEGRERVRETVRTLAEQRTALLAGQPVGLVSYLDALVVLLLQFQVRAEHAEERLQALEDQVGALHAPQAVDWGGTPVQSLSTPPKEWKAFSGDVDI